MTDAKTRALLVALDGLKHEGVDPADAVRALYDAETAARMLRAVDGRIEGVVVDLSAAACRCGSRDEHGAPWYEDGECPSCLQLVELGATLLPDDYATFSPAETPQGASTHRPESETPTFPAPPSKPGDDWIWREFGWVNYGPNGAVRPLHDQGSPRNGPGID